ncbi:MAG: TrkH family potassium uptake protein [Clostridiales bacterium]|nr:TrkH family potassium uptake protein [Clostridiales bacterium]
MIIRRILPYLGAVLAILGLSMFFPMLVGYFDGDRHTLVFALTGAAGFITGAGLYSGFREAEDITSRDAYLLVTLTWLIAGVFGALPYLWFGVVSDFPKAFFESIAGFTTTGVSAISDLESVGRSILLWRSMTFWLGGLGIIVLFVSILSILGNNGLQMFRAETTGPFKEKVAPRIRETAKILWLTYIILTVIMILTLFAAGMSFFDAVCHAFGAISTGGFSTRNDNISSFSPLIRVILAFFAMISGLRIDLYYTALKERSLKPFWKNEELRVYFGIILAAVLLTTAVLSAEGRRVSSALMESYVQLTSAITSTGFISTDYTEWPPAGQLFVMILPFIGACSGSTGGGLKVGRFLILMKGVGSTLTRVLHPKAVVNPRINGKVVTVEALAPIQSFFFIYVMITVASTMLFCLAGYDLLTAFSVVGACINNVGTAFGKLGPLINYSDMPAWSMFFLPLLMLFGRLELYTVLVLFSRGFWRER